MKRIALSSLLMFATFIAVSAPVYRCGNSYSQVPCAGAAVVEADDSRSPAQHLAAKAVAADDRRRGHEMERERLLVEAHAPRTAAALTAPPTRAVARAPAAHRAKAKQRRYVAMTASAEFIAVAPRSKPR